MEEHAVAGHARRRGAKVLALQTSRAAGEGLRTLGARSSRQHVGLSCPRAKKEYCIYRLLELLGLLQVTDCCRLLTRRDTLAESLRRALARY